MFIALYKGPATGFTKKVGHALIKWWTHSEYSHCETVLDYDPVGLSLCASSSFRDKGVRIKEIDLQSGHWDILHVPTAPDQDAYARHWYEDREGAKYDLFGLVFFVWPWNLHEKKKWFCSEAVAEALQIPESWKFTPESLTRYLLKNGALYYATKSH